MSHLKCDNHPTVPAIALCDQCGIPLCGVCARYVDDNLCLCEQCESTGSLANYIESKRGGEPRVGDLLKDDEAGAGHQQLKIEEDRPAVSDRSEKIQIGVVLACCAIIVYQIVGTLDTGRILTPAQIEAEEATRNRIEDCVQVFWAIASDLSNGRTPSNTLRCADDETPMVVVRTDNDLLVRHPNPQALGLSELYITRSNPTPILVK